ncbi:hypothetical protein EEI76_22395 (plasmid) [Enterobacter cloacae]|nr:hypothetical protein EEI76_22395 [Enterobacter cloacae]UFQ05314.1 hypothetical protein [Enterobacter asburiae]
MELLLANVPRIVSVKLILKVVIRNPPTLPVNVGGDYIISFYSPTKSSRIIISPIILNDDAVIVGLSHFYFKVFYFIHMRKIFYFVTYLILFIIGFELLNFANVLDIESASRSEKISKFITMIIVLIAISRWGIRLYIRMTGYESCQKINGKK